VGSGVVSALLAILIESDALIIDLYSAVRSGRNFRGADDRLRPLSNYANNVETHESLRVVLSAS